MHLPDLSAERWVRTTQVLTESPTGLRLQACPPALRQAPESWLQRIWFWLAAPALQDAAPPVSRLVIVRPPISRRASKQAFRSAPAMFEK